jgi:cardiolipin synthase
MNKRRGVVEVPTWIVVLACIFFPLMILLIWSVKRRRDAHFRFQADADFSSMIPSVVGSTHASLIEGNRAEILENGRFFESLFEAMRSAERSITLEAFLWKPGKMARQTIDILTERSRAGVAVRVLLDGSGGKIEEKEICELQDAGCTVSSYHRLRIENLGTLNNRDHRKIVVIDGKIGYVGGHCFTDDWMGDARNKKEFRDISVRVEGPIVAELQAAFLENWVEETGDVLLGDAFFPPLEPVGELPMHLVYVSPTGRSSSVELLHYVAIGLAQKSVLIQNPYFVPDPEMIKALTAAVERGVDVRVMLPSSDASDSPIVQHASHHRFGALLEGGVRIFEYQKTLLHQKVMVVDGSWVSVGSCNFDDRSFELNDEVTLGIVDEGIAADFTKIFESDLRECIEASLESWKQRSLKHKATDFLGFLVNEQL